MSRKIIPPLPTTKELSESGVTRIVAAQGSLAAPDGSEPWTHYIVSRNPVRRVSRHRSLRAARVNLRKLQRLNNGESYTITQAPKTTHQPTLCPHCNGSGFVPNAELSGCGDENQKPL